MTTSPSGGARGAITAAKKQKNIYVIGPQASGKTTYLSALTLIDYSKNKTHKLVTIKPLSANAKELKNEGKNMWMSQRPLSPTEIPQNPHSLPEYNFLIEISSTFLPTPTKIKLNVRDYAGEFFNDLKRRSNIPRLEQYLNYCLNDKAHGLLLILPKFLATGDDDADSFYMDVLQEIINEAENKNILSKLRLAIVMSKCERGELWPGRWEPERDLFKVHLPQTTAYLNKCRRMSHANIKFFALSSFGVLDIKDPRPNRYILGRASAALNDRDKWFPYGLLNPLYWLATGKKWQDNSF
ncbi:MAG: hypothetical protein F6K31_18160 [Symploca sp. SIO2G7]|nr:hypothetical protein [Symploca sp. SIO2G7]